MIVSRTPIMFFFTAVACVGSIISFFRGVSNSDIKAIIAFSSVIHIAWVVGFISWGSIYSEIGVIRLLISHGISRPLLFSIVANSRASGSRSLFYSSNLPFPLVGLFILCLAIRAGTPPSLNFIREACAYISLGLIRNIFLLIFFIRFILGGLYSLFIWVNLYNP